MPPSNIHQAGHDQQRRPHGDFEQPCHWGMSRITSRSSSARRRSSNWTGRVAMVLPPLADAGATGTRETTAIKPGFYGQIPGNRRWWTRPAPIEAANAVAMAPHHGVPRGHDRGRWGAPIVMLRTTADTEYAFHFHVQGSAQIPAEDLGNCLLIGPGGVGRRQALLGSVCLLALRCAECAGRHRGQGPGPVGDGPGGRGFLPRAAIGGPSGLAPLRGLSDTDEDLAFLERFVRGLILADGQGELSAEEDRRLRRAVARQMQMPPAMRGLAGIAVMLGQRAKDGAASASAQVVPGRAAGLGLRQRK